MSYTETFSYLSGATLYAMFFRRSDGFVWNTSGTPAFEAWNAAHITDYDVAVSQLTGSSTLGIYQVTPPGGISSTVLTDALICVQAGGSPAVTDTVIATGECGPRSDAANTVSISGTNQTPRDIGASVLLSSGTGTGQLSLSSGTVTTGALSSGVITAASIAADAITDAKVASDVTIASVTGAVGSIASGGISTASFAGGATIPRCTLTDTLTTYTSNTPQTGDSYARIGAAGVSLTAVQLADAEDLWYAAVVYSDDDAASEDHYLVTLTRNGAEVSGTITVPKITVKVGADNSTLINAQNLTSVSGARYRYDALTTERQTAGSPCFITITATVDGTPQTFLTLGAGRDST